MAIALDKVVMMCTIMGSMLFGMLHCFSLLHNSLNFSSRRSVYFRLRDNDLHPTLSEEKLAAIEQGFVHCFDPNVYGGLHGKG